jgi:hypothetical protein
MAGGLPLPQEHVVAAVAGLGPSLRKLLESRPHGRLPLGVDPGAHLGRVEQGAIGGAADRLPAGALDGVAELYGLTAFERQTLLAAVAAQIEPAIAALFAALNEDPADEALTAGLAFELAEEPPWNADARAALGPAGTMVAGGLLTVAGNGPFHRRTITATDRIVQHLLGDDEPPAMLRRCLAPAVAVDHPAAARLVQLLADGEWFLYSRCQGDGGESIVVQAMRRAGADVVHVDLRRAPVEAPMRELLQASAREAALLRRGLVIGPIDAVAVDQRHALDALRGPVPVAMYGRTSWNPTWTGELPTLVPLPGLDLAQRRAVWQETITAAGLDIDAGHAAATYHLSPVDIVRGVQAAQAHAHAAGTGSGSDVDAAALAHGVRSQNAVALEQLARRVSPQATAAHLVLPDAASRDLAELVAWVQNRDRLIDEWGIRGQGTKGRGVTGLLVGASGTGKTLSAEVVAGELGLDLCVIDLSTVVSKYIGETEENLERVFREAQGINGVLLFDEADALFGKRTGVSDSKDRFANMEVAYLLQRMEQFDGVSLLASNLRANLDEAFTRRLDFVITFPDPGPAERERIWEIHLPPSVPRAGDVDVADLARRFQMSGGEIANAARAAGHAALRESSVVTMLQLVGAVAREYAKKGRLVRPEDFGDWAARIEQAR